MIYEQPSQENQVPAEVFPPGEYIRDELETRGWTQQDLAQILGRPLNAVNQIISGKRSITPEMAKGLGAAFGMSAEFWLNQQSKYQLARAPAQEDEVSRRARLFALAPVNEMIRRGWIRPSSDTQDLEMQLTEFFGTQDLDAIPELPVAARKSTSYENTTPSQRAWYYRAQRLAPDVPVKRKYDARLLEQQLDDFGRFTQGPQKVGHVPQMLADWGIRFLAIEPLQGTRIDGAAFWLDSNKPVVALSFRFDRIDAFWFTLVHELVHIKNRDERSIDTDLVGDSRGPSQKRPGSKVEDDTNAEASERLIPKDKLEDFFGPAAASHTLASIERFANSNKVHIGIVVGQLQHLGIVPFSHYRQHLVPVRKYLLENHEAKIDGWGHTPNLP